MWKIFFFKNHVENEASTLALELFLFFEKASCEVKAKSLQVSIYFFILIALDLAYNKNKRHETLSRDKLNFYFIDKGLGIVSPSHFVYDFFKKIVFHVTLYYLIKFHCLIVFTS